MVKRLPNDDAARLARIHDTRWLEIGVDVAALEGQRQERQSRLEAAAEQDRKCDALEACQAAVAAKASQSTQEARGRSLTELQGYRQHQQGRDKARDWDLSRPDRLRIDHPARLGDADPCCGVASMQKFTCEDLAEEHRRTQQITANKQAWEAQSQLHLAEAAAAWAAEKVSQGTAKEIDEFQLELLSKEKAAQAAAAHNLLKVNQGLARKLKAAEAAEIAAEKQDDIKELAGMQACDLLTEDPAVGISAIDPYRVRKDHYKGMSAEQVDRLRAAQLQQVHEHAAAVVQQRAVEAAHEQAQAGLAHKLRIELLKATMERQAHEKQAGEFLQSQIGDKLARDAALQKLYTNTVNSDFFSQFETSHR